MSAWCSFNTSLIWCMSIPSVWFQHCLLWLPRRDINLALFFFCTSKSHSQNLIWIPKFAFPYLNFQIYSSGQEIVDCVCPFEIAAEPFSMPYVLLQKVPYYRSKGICGFLPCLFDCMVNYSLLLSRRQHLCCVLCTFYQLWKYSLKNEYY